MLKSLLISYKLSATYQVNILIFGLKKIPILGKRLPDDLYRIKSLKTVCFIIIIGWKLFSCFLSKFTYMTIFVALPVLFFTNNIDNISVYSYQILLFLMISGAFLNNLIFQADNPKYYAISLMRMDAKQFAIVNYFSSFVFDIIGILAASVVIGGPLWKMLIYVLATVGIKLFVAGISIKLYKRNIVTLEENYIGKALIPVTLILIMAAYIPVNFSIIILQSISMSFWIVFIVLGLLSVKEILKFNEYHVVYYRILKNYINQQLGYSMLPTQQALAMIDDVDKTKSTKKGYRKLQDIFVKRHRKILWRLTKRVVMGCLIVIAIMVMAILIRPSLLTTINETIYNKFPMLVFILSIINSGSNYTRALFMNCDSSLLTFPFFRRTSDIGKLYMIRLKDLLILNLPAAFIIGIAISLFNLAPNIISGTMIRNIEPLYIFYLLTPILLSLFFSTIQLVAYYLLQPFEVDSNKVSPSYTFFVSFISFSSWSTIYLSIAPSIFFLIIVIITVVTVIIGNILVYFIAPKRFRLSN